MSWSKRTKAATAAAFSTFAIAASVIAGVSPASAATASANDDAFTYSAGWNEVNTAGATEHWSATASATATIHFTADAGGSTFSLKGVRDLSNKDVSITIDGGTSAVQSQNGSRAYGITFGTSPLLPAGPHTAVIKVVTPEASITGATLSNGTFGGTGYVPPSAGGCAAPPTQPTTPPAQPIQPTNPGTMAPRGDLPGWRQTFVTDFDTPAASAQVETSYPNLDVYPDESGNGKYQAENVTVANGSLNMAYGAGDGGALTVKPTTAAWAQKYGRYEVRFRADEVPGYGSAMQLWPTSNVWAEGETDFPEGDFGDQIHAYNHEVGPNPGRNSLVLDTGAKWGTWHTAVIEWTPTSMTFFLDGKQVGQDNAAVSQSLRNYVIQNGPHADGTAPAGSGVQQIDWIAVYAYAG